MVPFTSKPTSRNLRLPLTSLLAGLLLLFLLISGAAAMFLLNQNQDIRQQASTTDTTGGVYGVKNCSFGVADGAYYCDSASKSVIRKCDNGTLSIVKSCGAGTECSTSGSCKNSPTAAPATSAPVATDQPITCANGTFTDEQSCSRNNIVTGCIKVDNCWKPKSATEVAQDDRNRCTSSYAASRSGCGANAEVPCTCGAYTACESGLSISGGKCVNIAEEQEAVRKAAEQKLAEQRALALAEEQAERQRIAAQRTAELQAEIQAQFAQTAVEKCTSSGTYTCKDTGKKDAQGKQIFNRLYCVAAGQQWSSVGTCNQEQLTSAQIEENFDPVAARQELLLSVFGEEKPFEVVTSVTRGGVQCSAENPTTQCVLGAKCVSTGGDYHWQVQGVTDACYLESHPLADAARAQPTFNNPIPENSFENIVLYPAGRAYYNALVALHGEDKTKAYFNAVDNGTASDPFSLYARNCATDVQGSCLKYSGLLGGGSVGAAAVIAPLLPAAVSGLSAVPGLAATGVQSTIGATGIAVSTINSAATAGVVTLSVYGIQPAQQFFSAIGARIISTPLGSTAASTTQSISSVPVNLPYFGANTLGGLATNVAQDIVMVTNSISTAQLTSTTGLLAPDFMPFLNSVDEILPHLDNTGITSTSALGETAFTFTGANAQLCNVTTTANIVNQIIVQDATLNTVTSTSCVGNALQTGITAFGVTPATAR